MISTDALFTPFRLGSLQTANRVVMAPMTRRFSPNNVPNQAVVDYYRRRASSVGLIITEGTCVNHKAASGYPDVPFIYGEAPLAGWKQVVDAVHAKGGKIAPQLWHVGSARRPNTGVGPDPSVPAYTPSGLTQSGKPLCHAMTEQDIAEIVEAFAQAASDAKVIGFDGVEIHGAHGYLLDEFFWKESNQRKDAYGGSLEKRSRFAIEIIQEIRRRVGPQFPIILRWSQWKQQAFTAKLADSAEQLERFLLPLSEAGVDIFHCSTRRFWAPEFDGSDLNLAGWTKKITGKPTITVGSVGLNQDFLPETPGQEFRAAEPASLDNLVRRLENDEFDLVAVGRSLIANPDWAEKVRQGDLAQLIPYQAELLSSLI